MIFKNIVCLLFFFLITGPAISQPTQITLSPLGKLKNIELDKSLTYDGFEANSDYLTWIEYYLNNVVVYNIDKEKEAKIELTKGRGPNEFQSIMGLVMDDRGTLNILDPTNIKFIHVGLTGEFSKDTSPPTGFRPLKMVYGNGYLVILDALKPDAIFYLIEDEKYTPIELTGISVSEEFYSPFKKMGHLTINQNKLIHLTQYYPYLYVYDLTSKTLVERIKFDDSDISNDKPFITPDGAAMHAPPSKVGILSQDIASVPGMKNRVFILAEGKSKKREYKLNQLHEYDLVKKEFVAVHDLGIKATRIASNNKYLFVYSKVENAIYKYEIVSQNK